MTRQVEGFGIGVRLLGYLRPPPQFSNWTLTVLLIIRFNWNSTMASSSATINKIERAHQMYREAKYSEALLYYTDALSLAKNKSQKIALHSNRAACFLKLHHFKKVGHLTLLCFYLLLNSAWAIKVSILFSAIKIGDVDPTRTALTLSSKSINQLFFFLWLVTPIDRNSMNYLCLFSSSLVFLVGWLLLSQNTRAGMK